MKRIEIIGNLAKDAVQVEGQNGKPPFLSFTVICNEKRGDTDMKTTFEVTTSSTGVLEYLKKGKQVFVAGDPFCRAYMNKENQPVAQMRIMAQVIELL